jgi:CRP-like cAMP-binding protein
MRPHSLADHPLCDAPPLATEFPVDRAPAGRRLGVVTSVPRGRALFWQGEHQGHNIEVLQGVIRAVRLLENGNRQVLAFFWPGDIVRPSQASCQHFTAEAVTPCRVVKYDPAEGVCTLTDPCGAHQVLKELLSLVVTMGQKNSIGRVASLLLQIRSHLPSDPRRPNALQLLLPRADMADHIGTSLETVCRALAEFKARRLIELPTRKTIRFLDLKGLSQLAAGCGACD